MRITEPRRVVALVLWGGSLRKRMFADLVGLASASSEYKQKSLRLPVRLDRVVVDSLRG